MSTFKNNLDEIFKKIFPAAAEAAEEDHGGFGLGDLAVIILDVVLLVYTGYRSWHFLSGSVSDEFQIMALIGLWGLDIGAVFWSVAWMFNSTTKFQNWASMGMFVLDLFGVFITSVVDTLAYGSADALPPVVRTIAWFGIPFIIVLNVLAGFVYHMTSPVVRRRRAERAQDEEMAKQREKGELELRRMALQLKQAQEYTQKRATMLISFSEIAEQNVAMAEIEAAMMAKLNKAAGGHLGSLMGATGLTLPGVNIPQQKNAGLADKLQELKNKITSAAANNPQDEERCDECGLTNQKHYPRCSKWKPSQGFPTQEEFMKWKEFEPDFGKNGNTPDPR
ncbi:MAG: hypothetical protein HRF47_11720 [Chloroflexota bacterium]|jgi:hypothetical protein